MLQQFKVALAQINCKVGDKKHNLKLMEEKIRQAKEKGAKLIVFPELALTGYMCQDLFYEVAEPVPGPATNQLQKIAESEKIFVVFGVPERSLRAQALLYNTAVLIGPNGILGKYRKIHLPSHSVFDEKRYFRPGCEIPIFRTEIGNLGLIVCYDLFFPEITRILKLKGAQLVVCISASPAVRRGFFETFLSARAMENTIFIVYTNLVGTEDGLQFWGGSRIIAPNGDLIAKAEYEKEDFIIGEIDYTHLKQAEAFIPTLKDLKIELFDSLRENAKKL